MKLCALRIKAAMQHNEFPGIIQIIANCCGSMNNLIVFEPSSIHHSVYASIAISLNLPSNSEMSLIKGIWSSLH